VLYSEKNPAWIIICVGFFLTLRHEINHETKNLD
jgi:hypothetical protein